MKKLLLLIVCTVLSIILLLKCQTPGNKALLNVHALPNQAPQEQDSMLAWGLLNLDQATIKAALNANAQPYDLKHIVTGLRTTDNKELSPYALALEGYLNRVYMKDDFEEVRPALDQVSDCIELLIKNNLSLDRGVITIGSRSSMRAFIRESIDRLQQDKLVNWLDEEGEYALTKWQRIQSAIDQYQPTR